jgi:hypothetical protein
MKHGGGGGGAANSYFIHRACEYGGLGVPHCSTPWSQHTQQPCELPNCGGTLAHSTSASDRHEAGTKVGSLEGAWGVVGGGRGESG